MRWSSEVKTGPYLRYLASFALLISTLAMVGYSERHPPQPLARPLGQIPTQLGEWTGADDPPLAANILRSLDATAVLSRTYQKQGKALNVFVAYYAKQKAGESMHSPKYCLPGGGWEPLEAAPVTVSAGGGKASVNKYLIQKGGQRALILYWYQSTGRIVTSEYQGKALLFWDALIHRRNGGSIVRLTLPNDPGALDDGLAFAPVLIAEMQRCLGG
jgi:EpsI family protein